MSRWPWRTIRVVVGAAILAAVLWSTGTGPLVDGLGGIGPGTLAVGAALAVPATVACAWRWRLVARGRGIGVALGPAVAACYRAQLLNLVLPGGVLGDVHRGVRHGRDAGGVARGLQAVAWERICGQAVQVAVTLFVLVLLQSPVGFQVPAGPGLLLAVAAVGAVALLARGAWPGVLVVSTVAFACHVATFLVAARAVGVTAPWSTLLPVAMLVLLAAALPVSVAGWGPREGMAAWSFAAAGLGAAQGVATTAAYAVIVLVANLPGAVVLVAARRRHEVTAVRAPTTAERPALAEGGPVHG